MPFGPLESGAASGDPRAAYPAAEPASAAGGLPAGDLPSTAVSLVTSAASSTLDSGSPSTSAPKYSRVVFLGPPNAGKGTQAAMLRSKLGVPGITTGDLLRRGGRARPPPGARG